MDSTIEGVARVVVVADSVVVVIAARSGVDESIGVSELADGAASVAPSSSLAEAESVAGADVDGRLAVVDSLGLVCSVEVEVGIMSSDLDSGMISLVIDSLESLDG